MTTRYRFSKSSRIRLGVDIRHVTKHGKRAQDALFTVYALPNRLPSARLGITVSRRISVRAVDRNRIKRLVRETFRHEQDDLKGLDVVVVAMPASRSAAPGSLRTVLRTHWMTLQKRCVPSS